MIAVTFFAAELVLSPLFGVLSDRLGHHRVMQFGPVFGAVAVVITGLTTDLFLLGGTRLLEGASTAASVPSILGFIAAATANDEHLRGQVAARFEAATIAGLGVGLVAAGLLWALIGPGAFVLNAGFYLGSLAIYRYGVSAPPDDAPRAGTARYGVKRYLQVISTSQVWILAPTWIAVNASLGLWTTQSLFQLVKQPDPRFADQRLMGGFESWQVSIGLAVGLLIFFAGLVYWGNRFNQLRRTTIIFYGIGGGAVTVVAGVLLNHSAGAPALLQLVYAIALVAGLFVLAGATPAALGLLADISEAFPKDRGAIMGLYSVFLAVGQITGAFIGGEAATLRGIDGLFVATLVLLGVALLPLFRLRSFEHRFTTGPGGRQPSPEQLGVPPD
jgi:MFS family permease